MILISIQMNPVIDSSAKTTFFTLSHLTYDIKIMYIEWISAVVIVIFVTGISMRHIEQICCLTHKENHPVYYSQNIKFLIQKKPDKLSIDGLCSMRNVKKESGTFCSASPSLKSLLSYTVFPRSLVFVVRDQNLNPLIQFYPKVLYIWIGIMAIASSYKVKSHWFNIFDVRGYCW